MEPIRVVAGAREPVGEAAARLRGQDASAAPVVASGRPLGLLPLPLAEDAVRHGLAGVVCSRLVCGGAPRVPPQAGLERLRRASIGIAPGLLVTGRDGVLHGVVTRRRLEATTGSARAPARRAGGGAAGVAARMNARIGPRRAAILSAAGALAASGGVAVYLVGGVVRDILLGRPDEDLDLVVASDGISFAKELARVLAARAVVHEAFGTAVLTLPDGQRIDVATARREVYDRPGSLPRVAPGTMLDDLLRRDLSINSMAIRLDGRHYGALRDELGGVRDLRAGRLRVHHMLSVLEDPTRAYRVARFAARFRFEPTAETRDSIALALRSGAFEGVTGERLWREFGFIAQEPEPARALLRCRRLGLLVPLGPGLRLGRDESVAAGRLVAGLRHGPLAGLRPIPEVPLLLLMVMSHRSGRAERERLAARLRISGEAAARLARAPAATERLTRALSRPLRASRIADLCDAAVPEAIALAWAGGPAPVRRALDRWLTRMRAMRPVVTGETLRSLGLPPGPEYRRVLDALRRARLDGRVRGEASEMALAMRLVAQARRRAATGRPD